jgi:transposase
MDEKGKVLTQDKVDTDIDSVKDYFGRLVESDFLELAVEPISSWYYFYEIVESLGCSVHLVNPLKVKAIASARIKTDKIDSNILAHLLRTNLLPEAYIPNRSIRDLKELLRTRASLVHLRTEVKNKIHALLHKNGVQHDWTNLFGKGGREFLGQLEFREPYQQALDRYLKLTDVLTIEIDQLGWEIQLKAEADNDAMLLTTIPGIGFYSALMLVSEIGDIKRFPSWRHLASYAGVVPSVYSSGGKTRTGRITRQGSKWLRWTVVDIAVRQAKQDSLLGEFYRKMKSRKGTRIARTATARKLLEVVYSMLKNGCPYVAFPERHSSQNFSPTFVS